MNKSDLQTTNELLTGLNPQQIDAVTAKPGPTLIVAGPGSGKTRVLTHRIAHLIQQGTPPFKIMAVTFTNKAAKEMRERVEKILSGELRGLTIGTFHSICARTLRREAARLNVTHEFVIFDDNDQRAIVKQALERLNLNDKQYRPQALLAAISKAKNELIPPEDFTPDSYFNEIASRVYAEYQKQLRQNNAYDFDDLLCEVVYLFRSQPDVLKKYQAQYDHVLVDEFQDTNTAQYAMVNLLTATKRNLYVVGDPDQSVYKFRGADYRNVKRFESDHHDTKVILLEQNYRSTQNILDAAMKVIDKNHNRARKQLFTERGTGTKIQVYEAYNEAEEAEYVVSTIATLVKRDELNASDMAIMYRTNAQSRPLEEVFIRGNLPYRLVGATRFYGRREVKDVIAFLRLVHNPNDTVSLQRIINVPTRGIGAKTVETLFKAAEIAQASPAEILLDTERCKKVGGRGGIPLSEFGDVLRGWIESKGELSVAKLIDRILSDVDYNRYINDGTEEGEERWDNVIELRSVAVEYPQITLSEFLEQVALVSDQDTLSEGGGPTLLTLHAAKGLEFGTVFLVGLDEGVLPHERSFEDEESMAEERRLMYVGLTRAKDRLFITRAFRRTTYGGADVMNPSRFLSDLPENLLVGNFSKASRDNESYKRMTTWGSPLKDKAVRVKIREEEGKYKTGQRVKHPMFGDGMIIESKGEGEDELVTIAFEGVGIKRLMASVADLKILKG